MSSISGMAYLILKWLHETPNALVVSYNQLHEHFMGYQEASSFEGPTLKTLFQVEQKFIRELVECNLIDVGFMICSEDDRNDYSAFLINSSGRTFLLESSDGII